MMTEQVRVFWTGPGRGRVWNLLTGDAGVVLDSGIGGQHFPEFSSVATKPARRHGRVYRATRFDERKVKLKVLVGDPVWAPVIRRGNAWRDLDDEWNSDLSEVEPGRLCFITNHGYRWLDLRVESATDPEWATEPGMSGMARYEYVLASDDAFYSGFARPYPVMDVAKGRMSGKVHNLGQYDRYPVVTFTGPGRFTFGMGERKTVLPELFAGETLTVDTDPDVLSVRDQAGRNRRPELPRGHDLSFEVPAGKSVEMWASVVNGTPGSKVTAVMSPRYRRAW
ncbi:minor tail protein [Gordonia phage Dardanus]|uniref:Minor tail protein n=1 Tax=Gordonia phage Dardanus TaxID=2588489 RepID=A0A514CX29_9CAUD|nr:minor tail protein [Gordonia phage Dardanus]QDH85060.1 minor tail protein [Gordonia phage Dardanus]